MIKKIKEFGHSASIIQKIVLILVIGFLNCFLYLIFQSFSLIIAQYLDWLDEWVSLFWSLVEIIFINLYVIIPIGIFLVYKLLPKKD
ncbi:MAG: hypothetical protein CMG59_06420 [Candidatus Marinimicrobia bacterium]|nr:hypothetical protein [Candidatus Neomarinimicrobiota bacterium]